MVRSIFSLTVITLLMAGGTGRAAPPGVLDLIPEDANAALMIRSITDLKKKGDRFLEDTKIDLGIRPTQALAFVYGYLGINAGVDEDGAAGIVLVDEKHRKKDEGREPLERLVLLVPFSDADKIAGNFNIKALEPGQVQKVKAGSIGNAYVAVRDRHLLLGTQEETVRSMIKSKPLAKVLTPERLRALEGADILLHIRPQGELGKGWKEELAKEEKSAATVQDVDPEARRQLFETLASLQHLFVTVRLEDGLQLRALTTFSKEMPAAAKQFLARLAGGAGASSLAGLPEGSAVAAQAAHGDGAQNVFVLKLLFHYVLQGASERVPFWATHLDPSQRLTVVGVATEIWKQLQGHRAAIYRNAEPGKQGLFTVVAILDTADAGRLLGEVKQLARFASNAGLDLSDKPAARDEVQYVKQLVQDLDDRQFLVRQSATTKLELIGEPAVPYLKEVLASKPSLELGRRAEGILARIATAVAERRTGLFSDATRRLQPSFAYVPQAEKLGETPVDVLRIKLSDKDIPATTQFRQFFGPDWDKVRVAVHGKQIVLVWGSNQKLLAEALQNLKESRPGLAKAKSFTSFASGADPGRKIEFHASLRTLLGLTRAEDLKGEGMPANPAVTSLALAVHADRMQYDLRLPVSEIKFLHRELTRRP